MIEQVNNPLTFLAWFEEGKVGKTGLSPTVDVRRGSTLVVTGGAATEVGGGLYKYVLSQAEVTVEEEYTAVFKTAITTVDHQHVPSLWVVNKAGVEHLDRDSSAALTGEDIVEGTIDVFGALRAAIAYLGGNIIKISDTEYHILAQDGVTVRAVGEYQTNGDIIFTGVNLS